MGYYTSYELTVYGIGEGHAGETDLFFNDLREYGKQNNCEKEIIELIDTGTTYAKFYYITDFISSVAHKYPHLLIRLCGDGESSMDIWEERWRGNDREYVEVEMPSFDNPKLKIPKEIINE